MAVVLLDTTVASLFIPNRRVSPDRELYEPRLKGETLALSFQSVAELWKLAEKRSWGPARRGRLDSFVRSFLIVPYDYELARIWARITAHSERIGRRLESGDAWIAATAVHRSLPLFTHDGDFVDAKVPELEIVTFLDVQ